MESIAGIKVGGWQTAYSGIVDEGYLDAMSAQEQPTRLKTYPLASFLVAEKGGNVLGFCRISEGCLADRVTSGCEIRDIYIRSDMKRQGIGTKLFEYTVQEVSSSGLELGAIRLTLLCFIMWSLWIKGRKFLIF